MIGPSSILDIGKRALFAHQYAMAVTAHNTANINTPGFSRQRAIFFPTQPLRIIPGPLGTGVRIHSVERMRDQLIDLQVRDQLSLVGEWTTKDRLMKEIETILNEPSSTGLSQKIVDFFNAWMDVANNPEESGPRIVLIEQANALASRFHRVKEQLQTMVDNLNEEVSSKVEEINLKSSQIAKLNEQIVMTEAAGQKANDLRDTRDRLIDELSKLADIQTVEYEDGAVTVYLNYKVIVDRANVVKLKTEMVERNGMKMLDIMYQNTRIRPESGEIRGILEVRDKEITRDINELDELARVIIQEVNTQHQLGYALDGSSGGIFFDGESASNIKVNSEIIANPFSIAASKTGAPGDGDNAFEIAELAHKLTMEGGNFTFLDFYRSVVGRIGVTSQIAGNTKENEETLLTQLDNYRESIRGVSIDEEMTNLINYQRAFEAASKVIQTADSLFATLIAMV